MDTCNEKIVRIYRLVASSGVLDASRRARLESRSEHKVADTPTKKPKRSVRFNLPETSRSSKEPESKEGAGELSTRVSKTPIGLKLAGC